MKSLKRTLSLVLVLVMVLGLFGVASATNFTDDAKIQYKEAVDVMTGIEAINGYTDGSFNPTGTITRAEAAKLVAYTILGKNVASQLPVTKSSFTDVGTDYAWAIPSIEYLVGKNIINGIGGGLFDPEGKITGYEIAKMLLVANGFGKNGEYVGDGWDLQVAIDANRENVNLFAGRAANAGKLSDAATREEAALYCFNAIQYSPSGSSSEQIYGIKGWKVETVGGKETLVPEYGWIDVPVVAKDSIMAAVYPTLKNTTKGEDGFGRPATVWTYTAKNTVISKTTAAPVAVFTKAFTQHDLYKALGAAASDITMTVNSIAAQTSNTKIAAVKNSTTTITGSGNGVITEIYKTSAGLSAVQIIPTFAKVTNVTATNATSTHGAYNTYTVGALSGKVYTTVVDKEDDVNTAVITGSVAKGSPVLYYQDGDGVLYIQAVGTVSGLLTSITSQGIITIGSTQTAKAAAYAGAEPVINAKQEQTYFVDSFGYLLGVKEAASTDGQVAMVLGIDSYSELKDGKIVTSYAAKIANADGTVSTVTTTKEDYNKMPGIVGTTHAYTVNAKGVYTFKADVAGTEVKSITTKNATLAAGLYANNLTKFVVANYTTDPDDSTKRVPTGTVTVYTGINNVPTYANLSAARALDLSKPADTVAEVVFIGDDINKTATNTYIYVLGTYTDTAAGRVWNTIENGTASTLTTATSVVIGDEATKLQAKTLYAQIVVAADGTVTATKATTDIDMIGNVGNLLFTSTNGGGNYGYVSGKTIADTTPVITISTENGTASVGTAADLVVPVSGGTDNIYVVYNPQNANAVAAVYILV